MSDTATTSASYLTQEAFDRLKAELDQLSGEGRTEIAKKIEAARDEGDLKENGGYHAAKEEQGKMEARIRQLTQLLENATVGERPPRTTASSSPAWSSRSRPARRRGRRSCSAAARSPSDSDLEVYSEKSPLGAAIIGKKVGDTASYAAPNGKSLRSRSSRPRRTSLSRTRTRRPPPRREAAVCRRMRVATGPPQPPVSGWRTAVLPDGQRHEDQQQADRPDQRVGDRVLQRPARRRRGCRLGCCRTARARPGSPRRPGSSRRTSAAPAGSCSSRHEGVGDERQREDHDERGVVDHLRGSAPAARPSAMTQEIA